MNKRKPPVDREKRLIPESLQALFKEADDQIRPIELLIRQLERAFNDIYDEDDPVWRKLDMSKIKKIYLFNIKAEIKFARPWAWCPMCGGGIEGNCLTCHGRGWVRLMEWNAIPGENK